MSIRLDPRRLATLKHLAAEAGVRPGDLVRVWVEERLDGERAAPGGPSLADQLTALLKRVEALERAGGRTALPPEATARVAEKEAPTTPAPAAAADVVATAEASQEPKPPVKRARKTRKASATPSDKVALHDEMIAVLGERGPLSAADLASAVVERGRYQPPRSKKPIDAAMVSQRVSNPTYRALFTRAEGRIGLSG